MALTPEQELELLQLEEEEAQAGGQTPTGEAPTQPEVPPTQPSVPEESRLKRYARNVANVLPIVGGIGGSFVAPIAGTMAGAAAGSGVKEAILSSLGDQVPTLEDVVTRVGKDTALAGALGAAGKVVAPLGKIAFAPRLAKSGPAIAEAEIVAGARLPRATEKLVKVGRTPEKARVEIDKIASTLEKLSERGKEATGRFLTRQKDRLDLILNKFTKNINARENLGQDAVVKATATRQRIMNNLNKLIPERVKPAAQYAAGKQRQAIMKGLVKTAAKAAIPASILAGLKAMK